MFMEEPGACSWRSQVHVYGGIGAPCVRQTHHHPGWSATFVAHHHDHMHASMSRHAHVRSPRSHAFQCTWNCDDADQVRRRTSSLLD